MTKTVLLGTTMLLTVAPAVAQDAPPRTLRMRPPAQATPTPAPVIRPILTPIRPRIIAPLAIDRTDSAPAVIVPPAEAASAARPNSMTLRGGGHAEVMRSLPPVRQINATTLRANPRLTLGRTKIDFKPMLDNPKALINIAQRARRSPQLIEVRADELNVVEARRGLVVQSVLTYRFKPGACSTAQSRARVAATGISCFTQLSESQRIASFSNPADPRYVADPGLRNKAIVASQTQATKIAADIAASVSSFRAQLNDPVQRAQLDAAVGPAVTAQLAALDDTALAGELANTAETKVEQVAYIPSEDKADTPPTKPGDTPPDNSPKAPVDANVDYDIGKFVFLTGFTLGRDYEWKQRVETTIKWCLVGCKKTYYAEVFAGFNYAFGLRFPLRLGGTYNFTRLNGVETATLTPTLAPINGTSADYSASGLPGNLVYSGKEFVAQFGAYAGAVAKLPVVGVLGPVKIDAGVDFTTYLPGDFKDGQFTPPAPGKPGPAAEKFFEDADLIGGAANFGVLGGKVFPGVRIELVSNEMTLMLRDKVLNTETPLTGAAQKIDLGIDQAGDVSRISIGDPYYNIAFLVTPGIKARLFIDLAVWGNNWDWPVWFPQLSIQVPSGGLSFACHAQTVCNRDFRFTPKGVTTGAASAQADFEAKLDAWGAAFDAKWVPQCLDETCKFGIRLVRLGTVLSGKKVPGANPKVPLFVTVPGINDANVAAKQIVIDSQVRKSQEAASAWATLAQAIWAKQCADTQCFNEVQSLAKQMPPRAAVLAKANPDESQLKITGMVNKEFGPKFSAAVKASKARMGQ